MTLPRPPFGRAIRRMSDPGCALLAPLVLLASLLIPARGDAQPPGAETSRGARKVLLIGIDGVRPDVLAAVPTPNIDALAAEGWYTDQARTTTPSVSGPSRRHTPGRGPVSFGAGTHLPVDRQSGRSSPDRGIRGRYRPRLVQHPRNRTDTHLRRDGGSSEGVAQHRTALATVAEAARAALGQRERPERGHE